MVIRFTHDSLEHDAGILHVYQLAGFFVDDCVHSPQHSVNASAVRQHFRVEPKTTVLLSLVERAHDFFFAPYFN